MYKLILYCLAFVSTYILFIYDVLVIQIIKIFYLLMRFSNLYRNNFLNQSYLGQRKPMTNCIQPWRKLTKVELDMEVLYNLQQHRLSLYKLNSNNKLIKYRTLHGSTTSMYNNRGIDYLLLKWLKLLKELNL